MLGASIGVTRDGQPAQSGVGTQVKLPYSPAYGPGASGADAAAYIPFGTNTASPTVNTRGTFNLHTASGVWPAAGFGFLASMQDGRLELDLPKDELSIRMPVRIAGVNPNWAAGTIREGSAFFEPLAPDENGVALETFDTVHDAGRLFFGYPVVCDRADIILSALQRHGGGWTVVAHNPGDGPVKVAFRGGPGGPLAGFVESATLAAGEEKRWEAIDE